MNNGEVNPPSLDRARVLLKMVEAREKTPEVQEMIEKAKQISKPAQVHTTDPEAVLAIFERLFGRERQPLFIPCARGTKKPMVEWGKLTNATRDEEYWQKLRLACSQGGNIAIKLGKESDHFVAIDFDDDALAEEFLLANEKFAETLCTRGSKGCSFWFWAKGKYPREVKRICVNGKIDGTGEWRGGKGLSTLWGIHPKGMEYTRVNDVPPFEYAFKDIQWPKGWSLSEVKRDPAIDWDQFNEMLKSGDGDILEALVSEYFEGAVETDKEWRCADLTGREPTNQGSFTISKEGGWCHEFDGEDWSDGIINTITSEERAEAAGAPVITVKEVFKVLKTNCDVDFFIRKKSESEATSGPITSLFAYHRKGDEFYFNHGDGWGPVSDTRARQILNIDHGIEEAATAALRTIMKERTIHDVAQVAGFKAGIHRDTLGRQFLVPNSTPMIEPIDKPWPLIKRAISGLLGVRQTIYFHAWMKWALESLRDQSGTPGHYLIIMGPAGCGKTLLQEKIISPLLGCGPTDCIKYITSKTDFNSDLVSAFHLMVSDGLAFANFQERKQYTERVKHLLANSSQRLEAKYQNAINVKFCCRLSNSLNLSAIESLPLLEEGMVDKLLLFKAKKHRHLPNKNFKREAYEAQIREELPGYANFLFNWKIPKEIEEETSERLGFKAYHNPEIMDEVSESSPEIKLAEMLTGFVGATKKRTGITVGNLYEQMVKNDSPVCNRLKNLCRNEQSLGFPLSDPGKGYESRKTDLGR